jgi:cobalamin-dependent methionine synthase I
MPLDGLTIIAEKINDSVPSTHTLFEEGKIDEIIQLAKDQAEQGGDYIDINVGTQNPELMGELVKSVQSIVNLPLSIDTPSFEIAEIGMKAYDPSKAGGKKPVLNSISLGRTEMFELSKIQPFKVILMASEHLQDGSTVQNKTGEDVLTAAKQIYEKAQFFGFSNDDIIFDPTIAPIGSDMSGYTKMTIDGIGKIGSDPQFKGCHISVGLSNFTVQIPSKTKSGELVKTPLESAFLTLTMPKGLDFIIGSTKKKYQILSDDHPALVTLKDILKLEGIEALTRLQAFYS